MLRITEAKPKILKEIERNSVHICELSCRIIYIIILKMRFSQIFLITYDFYGAFRNQIVRI